MTGVDKDPDPQSCPPRVDQGSLSNHRLGRCLCGAPAPCEHDPEMIEAQYRCLGPPPEGCKCSRCTAPKLRLVKRWSA